MGLGDDNGTYKITLPELRDHWVIYNIHEGNFRVLKQSKSWNPDWYPFMAPSKWLTAYPSYEITSLAHYNSKLGKILYK